MATTIWHRPVIPWTIFTVAVILSNHAFCLKEIQEQKTSTRLKSSYSLNSAVFNVSNTKDLDISDNSVNSLDYNSDGINKCMFDSDAVKCLKVTLLDKLEKLLELMKDTKSNETMELMDGMVTLETTPCEDGDDEVLDKMGDDWRKGSDEELNVLLLKALTRFFRDKALKLRFIPGFTLKVAPSKRLQDSMRFSLELSGENVTQVVARTMKMGGMMSSPWMMIGPMITLGMFPFMLANLKYMVMNAFMINNMALMMALRTTVNNLVFGDKEGDNIVYRNKGYSNEYTNKPQQNINSDHYPNRVVRYKVRPYNQINPPPHTDPVRPLKLHPSKPYHHVGSTGHVYHGGSVSHAYHGGSVNHAAHHGGSIGHHASPIHAQFPYPIHQKPLVVNQASIDVYPKNNQDTNKVKYIAEHDYFGDSPSSNNLPPLPNVIKQHAPITDYNAFGVNMGNHQSTGGEHPTRPIIVENQKEYDNFGNNGYEVHEQGEATRNVNVYAKNNHKDGRKEDEYEPVKYEPNHDYSGTDTYDNINTDNFQHSLDILHNTFDEPSQVPNKLLNHYTSASDQENTYEHHQNFQTISGVEDGFLDAHESSSYASKQDQTTTFAPLVDNKNHEEWVAKDVQTKSTSNWPIIYAESSSINQDTRQKPLKTTEVGTVFPVFPGNEEIKPLALKVATQNNVQLTSGIRFSSSVNNNNNNIDSPGNNLVVSSPLRQELNHGFDSNSGYGNGEVIIVSPHEGRIENNIVHNKGGYGNGEVINVSPYDNDDHHDIIYKASKDLNDENEFVNFPQRQILTPTIQNNININHKLGVIRVFDEESSEGDRLSQVVSRRSDISNGQSKQNDGGSLTVSNSPSERDVESRLKMKKAVADNYENVQPLYPFRDA